MVQRYRPRERKGGGRGGGGMGKEKGGGKRGGEGGRGGKEKGIATNLFSSVQFKKKIETDRGPERSCKV